MPMSGPKNGRDIKKFWKNKKTIQDQNKTTNYISIIEKNLSKFRDNLTN